ncbi:MAG: GreA/GreB family elongation factor [Kangiellaceae bacterium]|nr:GreA/GreB family elongation factor [Kangiellaceae bacterium]
MNKKDLFSQIILELESIVDNAKNAADRAHHTATDKENISQTRYDTLALEGAYLAQGQAARATEAKAELRLFKNLSFIEFSNESPITMGALVILERRESNRQIVFIGPSAGGLKLIFSDKEILVITHLSPLGNALLGRMVDDEFEIITGNKKSEYTILEVY